MVIGNFVNLFAMTRKNFYVTAGIFAPNYDLSWIPSAGTNINLQSPVETPNGINATFTFNSPPLYVIYNGLWQFNGQTYNLSGNQVVFTEPPSTGAYILGVF